MKKSFYLLILSLATVFTGFAQYDLPQALPIIIKQDMKLTKNTTYIINSNVIVGKNVTLEIEEGVTFISAGDKNSTFVMEPGAKLVANGNDKFPIKAVNGVDNQIAFLIRSIKPGNDEYGDSELSYASLNKPLVLTNEAEGKRGLYANTLLDEF